MEYKEMKECTFKPKVNPLPEMYRGTFEQVWW